MDHDQEVMGSNLGTLYWMDVSDDASYIKRKLKIKVAKWGTPKKYFFKKVCNFNWKINFSKILSSCTVEAA
jgi:hypothetical protein